MNMDVLERNVNQPSVLKDRVYYGNSSVRTNSLEAGPTKV